MAPTPPSQLAPVTKRCKYKTMTMAQKAAIVQLIQSGRSQVEVAREFGISKQTISGYVKNKAKILGATEKCATAEKKNLRQGTYPKLEEALNIWLGTMVAQRIPISGDLLKEKAETLALRMGIVGCKFSDGWLRNFKKRYDLVFKKMCGESGAVDNTLVANYRTDKLQTLLSRYSPDDVFNCDETGLFYKLLPEKTLAVSGDPCHGGKHSKERVTVLLGANMSGSEKLPLLVIGKSKNPRCFKGIRSLPVLYEANTKAWITQQLFEGYVRRLDRKFEAQKRNVLLFVDNCGAHGLISNLKAIQIEFLPPNTTSVLQPMDQGIIKNLKVFYRSRLLRRMVLCIDSGKSYSVDLLSAVHIVADAWKALTAGTIHRCFRHAGFVAGVESDAATQDPAPELAATVPDVNGDELIEDLRSSGVPVPATVNFGNFADVDSATVSCAELNDEEIVNEVLAPEEDDSDSEENVPCAAGPSNGDLAQALAVLSSCFSEDVTLAQIQADLVLRKRNTVQQRIEQFFQPQVL